MDVGDEIAIAADRLDRIAAADQVVTDVQAQSGAGGREALGQCVDLVRRLDPGGGVGMEGDANAIGRQLDQRAQHAGQLVERPIRPAWRSFGHAAAPPVSLAAAMDGDHQHLAAGRHQPGQVTPREVLGPRVEALRTGLQRRVQLREAQPARRELTRQHLPLGEAAAELDALVSHARDLVHDGRARRLRRQVEHVGVVPDDRHAADRRALEAHRCCSSARPANCSS